MLDMTKIRQNQYNTEKFGRDRYHVQYRINKKGAECFRTGNHDEAVAKLEELSAKRPAIYTMQRRSARLDRYGFEMQPMDSHGWEDLSRRRWEASV